MKANWTTSGDLREQLDKYWQRGDILRARLHGEPLFPLTLRLRKPRARDLAERFDEVSDWVQALRAGSRSKRGFGYTVHWRERRSRVQGSNELPESVTVATEQDALRWLERSASARRFSELVGETLARFPALREWLGKRPLQVLKHEAQWTDLLLVLAWFRAHPRSGLYLRELDIPGIHTKFIEAHRGLLAELLDGVLPASSVDETAVGVRAFNRRYGLRDKPVQVRFRILDPALAIGGLTDLAVPVEQFARLEPAVERVFITENEINGLAFPDLPRALVIFGLGYGVDVLRAVSWLAHKTVYYWGDIDTHGFAILHRFRELFPASRSLLMDRATLEAHRSLWGREGDNKRFHGDLPNLTEAEQSLYQLLRTDALAPALRLEQEQITQSWLQDALHHLELVLPQRKP